MAAFLTGSRAYGVPHANSDTDLVVFVSKDDLPKLAELADSRDSSYIGASISLHFGSLNLIAVTDETLFKLWLQGTEELEQRAPVGRLEAMEHFKNLFALAIGGQRNG